MVTRSDAFDERVPPNRKMTFEEYLDWCDEDTHAEWVDGEIVMTSPCSLIHQDIGSFLEKLLSIYVESHQLGNALRAPFVMKLTNPPRGREPDLLFVANKREHLLKETYLDGAADLAVEIVSPESLRRDRSDKFIEI